MTNLRQLGYSYDPNEGTNNDTDLMLRIRKMRIHSSHSQLIGAYNRDGDGLLRQLWNTEMARNFHISEVILTRHVMFIYSDVALKCHIMFTYSEVVPTCHAMFTYSEVLRSRVVRMF